MDGILNETQRARIMFPDREFRAEVFDITNTPANAEPGDLCKSKTAKDACITSGLVEQRR